MEYIKCENYPRCTFTECECHQKMLFEQGLKSDNTTNHKTTNRKIIRFEIVNDKLTPIYENSKQK
jgi:hypothetical protein